MVDLLKKEMTLDQFKMVPFAFSATVALGPKEGRIDLVNDDFATGVVLRKGKRRFIATVAHFVRAVPLSGMSVTFSPRRMIVVKDQAELLRLANSENWEKETTQASLIRALWHKCGTDLEDVAIIEIVPDSVPSWCWAPDVDDFRKLHAMPRPDEFLLLAGMPCRQTLKKTLEPAAEGRLEKAHFGRIPDMNYRQTLDIQNPSNWRDTSDKRRFFPSYHFALTYPTTDKIAPRGLSGGGAWRANEGKTKAGIIQPYPVLIGIENNYNDVRDCVKATSIKRVLSLLDGPKQCARCAARGQTITDRH
jgi:hypothetical protein